MFKDVQQRSNSAGFSVAGVTEPPPVTILRLPAVMHRVGLSRSSIYARMHQGTFPRSVRLGPRAIGFVEAEITTWLNETIEQRTLTH